MTGGARGTGAIGLAAGAGLLAMAACAPIPLVNVAPGADGAGSGGARAAPSLSEAPVPRPRWKPGAAGGREARATADARSVDEGEGAGGPAREAPAAGRVPTPRLRPGAPPDRAHAGEGFLWPIEGPLLSRFGPTPGGRHNDGINIAAPVGSAVRAAQDGIVAYAGNEIGGYGNLVLIRHRDGWMTAYAHNESLLVRKGEAVRRGQVISRSGNSGRVSRPQAHFEIRRHGEPQDPLRLLSRE